MRSPQIRNLLLVAGLLGIALPACQEEEEEPTPDPAPELTLPDVTGVDFEATTLTALRLALSLRLSPLWQGHQEVFSSRSETCPDLYSGIPDTDLLDGDMGDPGLSWYDYCETEASRRYSGLVYWETDLASSGDPETAEGMEIAGERFLGGSATVHDGDELRFQFDGEATDALNAVEAPDYRRWTWSSLLQGTISGTDVDASVLPLPDGFRTDMYLYVAGGDSLSFEARGEAYLFGPALHERFDSLAMDVAFLGPGAASPEDCALEPRGWVGLRDTDAFWYDVVFLPRTEDDSTDPGYENDPYSACDGCGTLYLRGLPEEALGQVCPDFGALWGEDTLQPPEASDYVWTLHTLEEEAP